MPLKPELTAAIQAHGARKVYDAGAAGVTGDYEPLRALGLPAERLRDASDALGAYEAMAPEDKAVVVPPDRPRPCTGHALP